MDSLRQLTITVNSVFIVPIVLLNLAAVYCTDERYFWGSVGVLFGWYITYQYGQVLKEILRKK